MYCAAPDIFSYSVNKKTSIKLAKSETSMEFFRRNFLMVNFNSNQGKIILRQGADSSKTGLETKFKQGAVTLSSLF